MTLIPNGQLVVFNFSAGGGGKMLQNCLGLSRHCVLSNADYIRWQLEYQGAPDPAYYRQKLEWILHTVPAADQMHNWLAYEIDKDNPVGFNFMGYRDGVKITNQDYYTLAAQGLWATAVTHNYEYSRYFDQYWPTVRHVSLVNCEQFARHSLAVKNVNLEYDTDWNTLGRTPPELCFNFDVDNTIRNSDKFLNQVQDLYEYLEFDDFQRSLVAEYHDRYIAIH